MNFNNTDFGVMLAAVQAKREFLGGLGIGFLLRLTVSPPGTLKGWLQAVVVGAIVAKAGTDTAMSVLNISEGNAAMGLFFFGETIFVGLQLHVKKRLEKFSEGS